MIKHFPDEIFEYITGKGVNITRTKKYVNGKDIINEVLEKLDTQKGAVFSSTYEYPGRYSRWDMGFVNPALELSCSRNTFTIKILNKRGKILKNLIIDELKKIDGIEVLNENENETSGLVKELDGMFSEEERSKQVSLFTIIRVIKSIFESQEDETLGLYGAFGYDLIFQFQRMELKHKREDNDKNIILFIPDEIFIMDHKMELAYIMQYDFETKDGSTKGLERTGKKIFQKAIPDYKLPENIKGTYASKVVKAMDSFKRGDLFEVVPSWSFYKKCPYSPRKVFEKLKEINPSPYGFIMNLGDEILVGSSPEMYVRVEGKRVETCPISGTIKRGANAIEDADRIKELLNSSKDESELTMCTDVDRNDKSRVCVPGTVNVIGRRQIEKYSHLIHTVDHVEGTLDKDFDAIDAFITHMWAVTITGAPKLAAVKWIEDNEEKARGWYGGAIGCLTFNGDMNTGLVLRTMTIKNEIAEIRAGATLLFDSIPELEEEETRTKARALIRTIELCEEEAFGNIENEIEIDQSMKNLKILIVDHEDSFVNTLGNYFRQFGPKVKTMRYKFAKELLKTDEHFDLVLLSPGPGTPSDFDLKGTIDLAIKKNIPIFGVCLGLQGIVEYFGGKLGQLDYPCHGKSAKLNLKGKSELWEGINGDFEVGRYHSLYALEVPDELLVSSETEDGIVMSVEHKTLAIKAVQFHPESILSLKNDTGKIIIKNVLKSLIK